MKGLNPITTDIHQMMQSLRVGLGSGSDGLAFCRVQTRRSGVQQFLLCYQCIQFTCSCFSFNPLHSSVRIIILSIEGLSGHRAFAPGRTRLHFLLNRAPPRRRVTSLPDLS